MDDTGITRETLSSMSIADVLERWPAAADVLNAHATACVGCVLSLFCTVLDTAASYHLRSEQLIHELLSAIEQTPRL